MTCATCPAFLRRHPLLRAIAGAVLLTVSNAVIRGANWWMNRVCPIVLAIALPERDAGAANGSRFGRQDG